MKFLLFIILTNTISSVVMSQSYLPLESGNEWHMEFAGIFNKSGAAYSIIKVLEEKVEVNGLEYFQVQSTSFSNSEIADGFSITTYARLDTEGNIYGYEPKTSNKETLMYPGVAKIGTTWNSAQGNMKVVALDDTLKTPKKAYTNCLVVEVENQGMIMRSYAKKGIGLVGMEMNGQLMMFLDDYELK